MLRLLPDRYVATVGSGKVCLLRQGWRGGDMQLLAEQDLTESEGDEIWPGLATLETLLENSRTVRRVSLVLHDEMAAYATLPWPGLVLNLVESDQLAAIRLQELHGTRVAEWKVRSWQEYRCQGVACAIPAELVQRIVELGRRTRVAIAAVRPALAELLWRARVRRSERHWLAVDVTSRGCLLALHSEMGWASVRFVRYTDMPAAGPLALIRRECMLLGTPEELPIVLHQRAEIRRTTLAALHEEASIG